MSETEAEEGKGSGSSEAEAPASASPVTPAAGAPAATLRDDVTYHLRYGWIGLLVFITLGTVLELLHAFKSGAYLGVGNETRRLMWTLAHAHGIGLSLLHIGFAATLHIRGGEPGRALRRASTSLSWAAVLLPGGFFLGGIVTYGGDPGLGVLLVPVGAVVLWLGSFAVVSELTRK